MSGDEDGINSVSKNNAGWSAKHPVDFRDIRDINVPVINIVPYGLDAHKKLEREEMKYSLEIVANITNLAIRNLLTNEEK